MGQKLQTGLTLLAVALIATPFVDRAADPAGRVQAQSVGHEAKAGVDDAALTAKTKLALVKDRRVKARDVSVETIGGQIYLRGKVDSDEAKNAAEELAAGVEGAKVVKNDLQVVPPSDREAVDASDKAITTAVKSRLAKEPDLKGVNVRTDAGTVILSGRASTTVTSARAADLARDVSGVKSVTNDVLLAE